jgi:hypothetical protein
LVCLGNEFGIKMWSQLASLQIMDSDSVLGSDHMNLTPIPLGLFCSSQAQQFDQTTWATTCMEPEGPLTVNNNKSFGHNVLSIQMNAPLRLMFLVSPRIAPAADIADICHLSSALRYMRFSSVTVLSPFAWGFDSKIFRD